jgi:RecJ-like exonuclease
VVTQRKPKTITQSKFFNTGQPDGFSPAPCTRCAGSGQNSSGSKCPTCQGHGRVYIQDTEGEVMSTPRTTSNPPRESERPHIFETEGRQEERHDSRCAICGETRQHGMHRESAGRIF